MNDFTKEELQDIYDAVMDTEIPILGYLPSKIQSLIDDYCEHKNIVTGKYPRSNPPIKCDSCGVLYYE